MQRIEMHGQTLIVALAAVGLVLDVARDDKSAPPEIITLIETAQAQLLGIASANGAPLGMLAILTARFKGGKDAYTVQ